MTLLFTILLAIMPPCEYEDSTNCQHQGQFVALHTPGSATDTLLFADGHIETMPTAY